MVRWVVGSILHGGPIELFFSLQPVLDDWFNKGCGMCYPVHIKEPLLLIVCFFVALICFVLYLKKVILSNICILYCLVLLKSIRF